MRRCKHGHAPGKTASRIYQVWDGIIGRCTRPSHVAWHRYGGRGITVCDRWRDFRNFLADMGEQPFEGAQIDRIDNDAGYSPENCRWVTQTQNMRNSSNARMVTLGGETRTMAEWCERLGLRRPCLRARIKVGWSDERILSSPPDRSRSLTIAHATGGHPYTASKRA